MLLMKCFFALSISYILIVFLDETSSLLVVKPRNTVSVKGNRTELKCRRTTNDNTGQQQLIDWDFTSAGESGHKQFYFNGNFYQNYSLRYAILRNETGQFDLVINNVDLSHAGTYKCRLRPSKSNANSSASAELVVLDSDPVCNATFLNETHEHADYEIQCSVSYNGNANAMTECFATGGNSSNNNSVSLNSTPTKDIRSIASSILTSTLSVSKLQNTTFICKVTFTSTDQSTPGDKFEYVYSWTYNTKGSDSKTTARKSVIIYYVGPVVGLLGLLIAISVIVVLHRKLCNQQSEGVDSRHAEPSTQMQPSHANDVNSYSGVDSRRAEPGTQMQPSHANDVNSNSDRHLRNEQLNQDIQDASTVEDREHPHDYIDILPSSDANETPYEQFTGRQKIDTADLYQQQIYTQLQMHGNCAPMENYENILL